MLNHNPFESVSLSLPITVHKFVIYNDLTCIQFSILSKCPSLFFWRPGVMCHRLAWSSLWSYGGPWTPDLPASTSQLPLPCSMKESPLGSGLVRSRSLSQGGEKATESCFSVCVKGIDHHCQQTSKEGGPTHKLSKLTEVCLSRHIYLIQAELSRRLSLFWFSFFYWNCQGWNHGPYAYDTRLQYWAALPALLVK